MDYNYFIKNPLKINILDKKLEILKTYIILGNVEDSLYKSVMNRNEKHLKEFYGNDWASKLNIKTFDIKGAAESESEEILSNTYANIFSDEDILEIDFDSVIINKDALTDSRDKKNIIDNSINDNIYIKDIQIFSFDSLYDIKKKISIVTRYQIYEQHFMTPITYDILLSNEIYGHYYNFDHMLNDVPYDNYLYENRYNISLKVYDNCKIIGTTNEVNILPLQIFLKDKHTLSKVIKNEREHADIIYYSFIFKYYPMISFEMFIQILHNNDEEIEIYKSIKNLGILIKNEYSIIDMFQNINITKRDTYLKNNYKTLIFGINCLYVNTFNSLKKNINILDIFNTTEISKIKDLECIQLRYEHDSYNHNVIKINKNIIISDYVNEIMNSLNKGTDSIQKYLLFLFKDCKFKIMENGNIEISLFYEHGIPVIDKKNIISHVFKKIEFIIESLNVDIKIIKESIDIGIINYTISHIIPINQYVFGLYKKALDFYTNNQFLINMEKQSPNYNAYAIAKMVYSFPPTETYTYVDQLPITNSNIKTYEFNLKNNILSISLTNIFQQESFYALELLYNILFLIKDELVISRDKSSSNKKLAHTDPVLFGYKSDDTYSRVCQKKYQPKIIEESKFNELKAADKQKVVKYPNITTGEEIYYKCPQAYPYMKFLKNYHPDGYCLPCCIKKDIHTYSGYIDIHNSCLKTNIYPADMKIDNASAKKYIINYSTNLNNSIDIDRIIELPTIFKSLNIYLDDDKYHLIKISDGQFSLAYILANSLKLDFNKMIYKIISILKEDEKLFNVLLSVDEMEYFNTNNDLIKYMMDILLNNITLSIKINWNKLFIKFATLFNIQFIVLNDKTEIYLETIKLIKGYAYIVVILNNGIYYPIWLFDNNMNVKQKIYTDDNALKSTDSISDEQNYIIKYIKNIINIVISKNNIKLKLTYSEISEYAQYMHIKLIKYYNNIGSCYSVGLNDNITCPIETDISHHSYKNNIFPKIMPNYPDVLKFIKSYNEYIYGKNKHLYDTKEFNDYMRNVKYNNRIEMTDVNDDDNFGKYIRIQKFIMDEKNITGILIDSGIIYIKPIKTIKFHSYNTNILNNIKTFITREWIINKSQKYYGNRYSFNEMNNNIIKPHNVYKHDEYLQASYKRYSYKLFVMQIINFYKKRTDDHDQKYTYNAIESLLIKKYDLEHINKELLEPYITRIMKNKSFDQIELSLFKYMKDETIKKILTVLTKLIFTYGQVNNNNMEFLDCMSNKTHKLVYCKGNKMVMEKELIERYIDLLTIDLKNPFKYDLINNLYEINMSNSYKTYPNEFIYIV